MINLIDEKFKTEKYSEKTTKVPRKTQMQAEYESYDKIKALNSTNYNITFRKMFDVSPIIRTLVIYWLKL